MSPAFAHRRRAAGFTLIELLIVIIIVGILVAIGVPAYLKYVGAANDRDAQAALRVAYKAAVAGDSEVNSGKFPVASTIVNDISADEPAASVARGDCYGSIANAPAKQVLVDPSSTTAQVLLCARSASGTIWRLAGPLTGEPTVSDGSSVALTFTGGAITDASRAAKLQGDGLTNDSSTGVWQPTTNMILNGGLEAGPGNWSGWAIGSSPVPLLARDTSQHMFGTASLRVDTQGANATEGATATSVAALASTVYTVSSWVKGTPGQQIRIGMDWKNSGTYITGVSSTTALVGSGWQRLTFSATSAATANQITPVVYAINTVATPTTFWVDGFQLEQKPIATPYVDTSTGPASRANASIQAPASLLTETQGWYAIRLHLGFAASASWSWMPFFAWTGGTGVVENQLPEVVTTPSANWEVDARRNGTFSTYSTAPDNFNAGDGRTVIVTWTNTTFSLSVAGAAFSNHARAGSVGGAALPSNFTIGSDSAGSPGDANVSWFACGVGTLSDADAAAINALGDNDPKRSSFPANAQTTMVWDGTSSAGSLK